MSGEPGKSSTISTVTDDLAAGRTPDAGLLAQAVRESLRRLAAAAPGRSVEVRVPPYGAVQCAGGPAGGEAPAPGGGPRHTRGTPPNVVEADPVTWLRLVVGDLSWPEAITSGRVRASGPRSDLTCYLPLA